MNYLSRSFLLGHVQSILDFYEPNVIDPAGGFFQNFRDDGTVFDPGRRHLVSSCRMVFNYCKAYQMLDRQQYLDHARHGLEFIRRYHWDASRGGYHWTLTAGREPDDQTNQCYGLAFVMLCLSAAHELGLAGQDDIERVYRIMQERFWQPDIGVYADEATPDWSSVGLYRGQNANMHSCEALLAAFEATGNSMYLDRASALAEKVAGELADKAGGLVWEHYTPELDLDWDYNRDDPKNLYRPWGFQPGHQTEWAKLLLTLHAHCRDSWLVDRARNLFDPVMESCWDGEHGGIYYGFAPDGQICDSDKYFWVQAETIAASARLYHQTGDAAYLDWYEKIWQYAWDHMIDHRHGAWFRVLTADNQPYSDEKSAAGAKCDYHTIGACWDVLRILPD